MLSVLQANVFSLQVNMTRKCQNYLTVDTTQGTMVKRHRTQITTTQLKLSNQLSYAAR